jgi:hypothetical protein
MAQVAHATSAVLHETREREETAAYLADLKHMRKVSSRLGSHWLTMNYGIFLSPGGHASPRYGRTAEARRPSVESQCAASSLDRATRERADMPCTRTES